MPHAKWLQSFLVALALLTRLGPSRMVDDASLARSRTWFALVGAVLGFIYTFAIIILFQIYPTKVWALAWVYLAFDIWLTRGLHYDGLADVGDAIGSSASGDKFWTIMHDSRLGAFGAIALFLGLSAQFAGLQHIILQEQWYVLIIAPIFGRILCVLLANVSPARNPDSLGGKVCTPKNNTLCISYLILSLALLLPLGIKTFLTVHLIGGIFFYLIYKIAQKHGGCNGDFLGTVIIGGQCIILLIC